MAFVFRSDRPGPLNKENTPGPGTYSKPEQPKTVKSYAPFGSTATKQKKQSDDTQPGPGSYNISGDLKGKGANQKILVSSLTPDPAEVEKPKQSMFFKSKAKRFEQQEKKDETPGPGQYNPPQTIGKKYPNPNATAGSQRYQMIERAIKNTKFLSIPSIPSNLHSYGYSETPNHDLILNKNPLLEVQQFVGPGYYEVKDQVAAQKKKGATWHKSKAKRFGQFNATTTTPQTVGPGSYEVASKNVPFYKLGESAGFASKTRRTMGAADKAKGGGFGKFKKRTSVTADQSRGGPSAFGLDPFAADDEDEEEEYIEDATPGPGYYYNETNSTSLKVSYKPFHLQNFGSVSLRFKEQNASNYLGPGEYNVTGDIKRKTKNLSTGKAPFQSSNTRFIREKSQENPGPGQYQPKTNILDNAEDKKKKGYLGNFGVTDKRFKQLNKGPIPGPGTYFKDDDKDFVEDLTEVANKASHYFKSSTKRNVHTGKKDDIPPPGAYDNKYYDISNKVTKEEEDPDLRPTRKPFNTGEERFKAAKIPEISDDDEPPKTTNKNLDHLLNQKKRTTAPFNSTTKREQQQEKKKVPVPGPGAYHDPNSDKWNKRTFNILFTVD